MPQETGDAAVPLSSCADIPASTQLNHGLEPEFFDINQPLDESGVMAAMDIGAALVSPHFGLSEAITSMMLMDSSTGLTPNLANSDDWAIDANRQQHIYNTLQFPMSNPFNPFNSANYPTATTALFFANAIGAEYAPSNGTSDMQAVSFHRVVFAPLKSTRTPAVSAHALFLNRALENCMALHFLLAVSHSELAIHQGAGVETPQESWTHFQRGSKLFLQALDPLSQPDHVAMMLSFLYMYMFWMRRSPLNVQKLRELSDSVLAYVKSYNLDELCASASVSASPHSPTSDQVLIARILTYLYDRDGFCDFFGCGGAFASYVSQNHEKRHRIWRLSRTTFPGTDEIPTTLGLSQVPKIPDSAVLSVYFDLIAIHHDINCYSQAPEDQTLAARVKIKRSLDRIQEVRRHSLRLRLLTNVGTSVYFTARGRFRTPRLFAIPHGARDRHLLPCAPDILLPQSQLALRPAPSSLRDTMGVKGASRGSILHHGHRTGAASGAVSVVAVDSRHRNTRPGAPGMDFEDHLRPEHETRSALGTRGQGYILHLNADIAADY
ncbi:Zn2-C6 fungal-type DNA-binding domain [Ilyonectria robusta]